MLSWSLNTEPFTRSVRKDELHIALEFSILLRNFIDLNLLLYEIKNKSIY